MLDVITPTWSAPACVKAYSTCRRGGVSENCYASLNLGAHVGDKNENVLANRQLLEKSLSLPGSPVWLQQVHGIKAIELTATTRKGAQADASYTKLKNKVCAIMTADCLPVLLCNRQGSQVAAVHAGWRGLAAGVIESTLDAMGETPQNILAWLGPAIGPQSFEVGTDVIEAFVSEHAAAEQAFVMTSPATWLADMYTLARQRLKRKGVNEISGGGFCTYQDKARFFSYRRDGVTGRMATLIWIEA